MTKNLLKTQWSEKGSGPLEGREIPTSVGMQAGSLDERRQISITGWFIELDDLMCLFHSSDSPWKSKVIICQIPTVVE